VKKQSRKKQKIQKGKIMKKSTLIALETSGGKPIMHGKKLQTKTLTRDAEIQSYYNELEVDVLARTVWGEARGEGDVGMVAVAHVILNRVQIAQDRGGKYWWGGNIIQVCQKPYQFSCWNRSDPNFRKLQSIDATDFYFSTALRIARGAIKGVLDDDPTQGATHYHAAGISPYWTRNEKPTAVIGDHIFYELV
jgi:N-acetylmuramoyl-L-alanine amidase